MFQRSRTLFAIAAALLLAVTAAETNAGDRMSRHHHVVKRINIRSNIRIVDRSVTVNIERHRPRHRVHNNVNTYSGDVAIYYRRGVGTWSYGVADAPANAVAVQPNAKIIDLQGGKTDCSMEKGVCVIRP